MSDTPRTDKQTFDIECIRGDAHLGRHVYPCGSGDFVESNFARQLERELAVATMELQTLRTANAGLVERVKRLEEAGDGLRKASWVFLLSFVDNDYGADDGTPIDRVDPDASVQWEDPPTAGEHVQLQNAINRWAQAKGQP